MSQISTHVLDTALGRPAAGVAVVLVDGTGAELGRGTTDDDGRIRLGPDRLEAGAYRLTFGTGAYFADTGRETFFPAVSIDFTVAGPDPRYHVPLLISPFAYSSYRGS